MSRTLRLLALALSSFALFSCATPAPTRDASRLQLEAFGEAEQSVAGYSDLVAKQIRAIQSLRRTSGDLEAVVGTVDDVAEDAELEPMEALDRMTNDLAAAREKVADRDDPLQALLNQHRAELRSLRNLLLLMQKNQSLIDLYLSTDIGPSADQITNLRKAYEDLQKPSQ